MSQGKRPRITVIMTSHNDSDFIHESVESILNQTVSDFEFLIIDDGSVDATPDIATGYARKDHRLKLVAIAPCMQAHALNVGLQLACGDYIALMDSDDVSLPDRLETQCAWIRETGYDICGSQVETFGDEKQHWWYPETHEALRLEQLFRVGVIQSATMMRACVGRENPYREDVLAVDYEWPVRMSLSYRLGNVPKVLVRRRVHRNNTSALQSKRFGKEFSGAHFQYFYALFPQAGLNDYMALLRIAGDGGMTSLSEMERAGRWLVDLSRHPDTRLRRAMAHRWKKVAERSSGLGNESQDIFKRYQSQIMQA